MSWNTEKLKQTLRSLHYENVNEAAQDILEATRKYSGLTAVVEPFKFNNGNQESRLLLTGRILIQNEGSHYNIPILIWLPTAYPNGGPPDVFVKPTPNMPIKSDPCLIDETGKISMLWLDSWGWNRYDRSNMVVELIDELIKGFSQRLPVTVLRPGTVGCRLGCRPVMKMCSPTVEAPLPLSTKRNGLEIRKTLQENLYENVVETLGDILEAALKFVDLDVVLHNFAFNNGTHEPLVTLKLPVRIVYEGSSYNIPVMIWLPKKYPVETPKVFVKASNHRPIDHASKYVNDKGLVLVSDYLLGRKEFARRFNLVELIDALGVTFTDQSPVRLKAAKECCLLCFQHIPKCESWRKMDPMVLVKKCKVLRTFCQHMMSLHPDDIPTVISEDMFPLCRPCEELVDRLWECYETIRNAQLEMAGLTQTIEKKVVECEETASSLTSTSDATEKRFMKLRKVIYEDYQTKLHAEDNNSNKGKRIMDDDNGHHPSESDQSTPSNDGSSFGSDEETEGSEPSQTLPEELGVTQKQVVKVEGKEQPSSKFEYDDADDPYFEETHTIVKIEVDGAEGYLHSDESEQENDFDEEEEGSSELQIVNVGSVNGNIPPASSQQTGNGPQCLNVNFSLPSYDYDLMSGSALRTREGTLLIDGCVDIYWTRPFRDDDGDHEAYLQCSICFSELRYSTTDEKGMEKVFRNMEQHILEDHEDKKNEMILRFGKRTPYPCPNHDCCLLFANLESRDKHEEAHRTCKLCRGLVGIVGLTRRQQQLAMLAHQRSHYERGEGGIEKASVIKEKKTN